MVSLEYHRFLCFLFDWIKMVTRPLLDYVDNISLVLVIEE